MHRRSFLSQSALASAGVAASPMLSQASEPKTSSGTTKYLFVLEGNGLPQRQIHPREIPFIPLGERKEYREFRMESLPLALEPVADWMDQMCIVQGVSGRICTGGHSNDHGTLGSYNARDGKLIAGPTIDYLIGARQKRIFDNVVLGINGNNRDVVFNCSAAAAGKPIATVCNPLAAYNRLFGALGNAAAIENDEKIIAYLKRDIDKSRRYLGDDQKLRKYDAALSSIVQRNRAIRETTATNVPQLTEKYRSQNHVEMLDAHFEMATSALQNDLTDSATIAIGVGYQHFQIDMSALEGVFTPRHSLGHETLKFPNDLQQGQEPHHEAALVRRYVFSLIARTLRSVDRLVVVYCSDAAEKHHSNCHEWPHVFVSNTPALRLDGRFIYYPEEKQSGHKTINALHNTVLRSAGIQQDAFGQFSKNIAPQAQRGVLAELLS